MTARPNPLPDAHFPSEMHSRRVMASPMPTFGDFESSRQLVSDQIELLPISTIAPERFGHWQMHSTGDPGTSSNILSSHNPETVPRSTEGAEPSHIPNQTGQQLRHLFTSTSANHVPSSLRNQHASGIYHRSLSAYVDSTEELERTTRHTIDAYGRMDLEGKTTDPWLNFEICESNGGVYSEGYQLSNILEDDRSVYCSRLKRNVNIIMSHVSPHTPMRAAPFWLDEVFIRVPDLGFTSPLKNGFIFICTDNVSIDTFDAYDTVDTTNLLDCGPDGQRQVLPQVPASVKTVLFFQFDQNTPKFHYRFQSSIKDARYIFVKMLNSFGTRDNIDVEFIGFRGRDGKLCFPKAELL